MSALDLAIRHRVEPGGVFTLIPTHSGFAVVGDLDVSNGAEVARMLSRLVDQPGGRTVSDRSGDIRIDMSEVTFADVGTAALLIAAARRLGPGRTLVLRRPPAPLLAMLSLLCPDGVEAIRVVV